MRRLIIAIMAAGLMMPECPAQTKVIAHRGYWNCEQGGFANNSIAALKAAQDAGFYGSEFDVNMTSDEILLVHHDGRIGNRKMEKHPAAEFADERLENGESIPTLDDYLEQAVKGPSIMLVLELKPHSSDTTEDRAAELCIERLKAHRLFSPDKVMFISFSLNICRYFARHAPGFTVQYLGSNLNPDELAGYGISGIDTYYPHLLLNKKWKRMARRQRMSINTWTVNSEKDIRKMIRFGVDQITTDFPELAAELVRNK